MKNNLIEKLDSIGGIEGRFSCTNNRQQIEASFLQIEITFASKLPQSYIDFYLNVGAFSFLELVCAKCTEEKYFVLKGNKVFVGSFYCIIGNDKLSVDEALLSFEEQLPFGLLPICDGELGDLICISLRQIDYGYIYYFHHESPPADDLLLIAKSFEDFIMSLEIYKEASEDNGTVKVINSEYSPQFIALLKKSGYSSKD